MASRNKKLIILAVPAECMTMPGMIYLLHMESKDSFEIFLDDKRIRENSFMLLTMPKNVRDGVIGAISPIGVVNHVTFNEDKLEIRLEGIYRAKILKLSTEQDGSVFAETSVVRDENYDWYFQDPQRHEQVVISINDIRELMQKFAAELKNSEAEKDTITELLNTMDDMDLEDVDNIERFIWRFIYNFPRLTAGEKQSFLDSTNLPERISMSVDLLARKIANTERSNQLVKRHADSFNQERGKNVKKGPANSSDANVHPEISKRLREYNKIKDSLREDVQKAILEDFDRLKGLQPGNSEYNTFISHLDHLLKLFAAGIVPQEKDIKKVEDILGRSHYGLIDIKERIYDYLATKIRNPKGKAPILCFVGPPGVGKTSIGKSVAHSLGLPFIRLSLGGVKDEADIRGHRLTYIGAIPGKIIQEIIRLDIKNPVFMLDEIDKLANDYRGDPSSALLEVLDPEQNHSFQDHYTGVSFDLSDVLFLCTANLASNIQPALRDRMDIINIAGYTEFEKIQIAKNFLVPKQMAEVGLAGKVAMDWPDDKISKVITGYTREDGVRDLERNIHRMTSRWGRKYFQENSSPVEIAVTEELIEELLDIQKFSNERVNKTVVGEAIGLAVTGDGGGDIMYIHAELTPHVRGDKAVSQTGGLLEVFREANKNALTVVKNILKDDKSSIDKLEQSLLHLSAPDLAIKKDGPSAGITMAAAIYSELTDKEIKPYIAMSGELTIKGRVRSVGGIKAKVLAAHRSGIKELILPAGNRRDVDKDVPPDIKKELHFHFVENISEVFGIIFPDAHDKDNLNS